MPVPSFDPAMIDALARVFAEAALDELLREAKAQDSKAAEQSEVAA